MSNPIPHTFIILSAYFCSFVYNALSFSFCDSVLNPRRKAKARQAGALLANSLYLTSDLFWDLPALLSYILCGLLILAELFMIYRGKPITFLFLGGTFLFHIMNVKMSAASLSILIFQASSPEQFQDSTVYSVTVLLTLLILLAFLEIFLRTMNRRVIHLLIQNIGQLYFVTTSLSLINVYLLLLSVAYQKMAYSTLAAFFLFCTSVLLYGAFYTAFLHAIRMSVLLQYQTKSRVLEKHLKDSLREISELQIFAFTDTLTSVHNRRYGLEQLEKLLHAGQKFCVCFLDIDYLKRVNDTYGHEEGDQYILNVVKMLTTTVDRDSVVSRLGGDEFLILIPGCSRAEADQIMRTVAQRVGDLSGQLRLPYSMSISYGISEAAHGSGNTASTLLQEADQEMYHSKKRRNIPRENGLAN